MIKLKYITAFLFTISLLASCSKSHEKHDHAAEKSEHSEEAGHDHAAEEKGEHSQKEGLIELTAEQLKIAELEYGQIENRNLSDFVKVNGNTKVPPQNKAMVTTLIPGKISEIYVEEGAYVKKGQTIARVENAEFLSLQREYLREKSQLNYVYKEYQRQRKLYQEKVTARKKFELAEANYQSEKANIQGMEEQLRQLGISPTKIASGKFIRTFPVKASITGYIGHIETTIGSYADLSQSLFSIVNNNKIHLDLNVFERDLAKVKVGQIVSFQLANQSKEVVTGKLFAVGRTFEPDSKAVMVHAEIDNSRHGLVDGMYVNANIEVGTKLSPSVPSDAITKIDGKEYIFVKLKSEDEHTPFKALQVKSVQSDMGYTEIKLLEKMPVQSEVVVKNSYYVASQKAMNEGAGEHSH